MSALRSGPVWAGGFSAGFGRVVGTRPPAEAPPAGSNRSWRELAEVIGTGVETGPLRLWLLRHGESFTNALGLVSGCLDSPLTETGQREAVAAGRAFRGHDIGAVWGSTMRRSIDTARIFMEAASASSTLRLDPRLNERCLGDLQSRRQVWIPAYAEGDLHYAPVGGEPYVDVALRCLDFLTDLALATHEARGPREVVVIGHTGPMRMIRGLLDPALSQVELLALKFDHVAADYIDIDRLVFPSFVGGEVLNNT
jgi:broad specificity phosphatase PhoE